MRHTGTNVARTRTPESANMPTPMQGASEISVLLVADELISRAALREMLARHREMRIIGECDTRAAVQEAHRLNPRVVVIHAPAPGAVTNELIQKLHHGHGVVVLSRESQEAYVRACFAAGALAYVLMRGEPADLLTAIHAAAARRRFWDPLLSDILVHSLLDSQPQPSELLSHREMQVLTLLAYGHTNQQIAERLSVSRKSVDTYRQRISGKLNLHSRADIVRYAISMGLMRLVGSG